MSCFILAYPEITPLSQSFIEWMLSDFVPQLTWMKSISPAKASHDVGQKPKIANQFLPEPNITPSEDKLCLILNKMTGGNRLMKLDDRMSKLKLRLQFVDAALTQL
jgi:hypothetical protein